MNFGKLNKRVKIRTFAADTATVYGGTTKGAATDVETWASVSQLSQSETLLNGLKLGEANFEITFRYIPASAITQRNELIYNGVNLRISSIIDVDEDNSMIRVMATERTN